MRFVNPATEGVLVPVAHQSLIDPRGVVISDIARVDDPVAPYFVTVPPTHPESGLLELNEIQARELHASLTPLIEAWDKKDRRRKPHGQEKHDVPD